MTIEQFIEKILKDYNLEFKPVDVYQYVKKKAKSIAVQNCAIVDDDTVKDWILSFDESKLKEPIEAVSYTEPIKKAEVKPKAEPKKKETDYEQITLFDLG